MLSRARVQDPGRSTLRLVSVGPAERTLLVSLARLYCLRYTPVGPVQAGVA